VNVAVVGSGISGLGAAWALSRAHRVTLYEADDRIGGHANTVEIADGGRTVPVDTGFIVYNERNYPNLVRLFDHLGVPTEPSDMSFSVSKGGGAFEYQARALGLLAQPSSLASRRYRRMVADILRFSKLAAPAALEREGETTRELLERLGLSPAFATDFLLPVIACIWSSRFETMLEYPARWTIGFLDNHGLLNVLARPRWRTVTGGSREYVARLAAGLVADVRLRTPVETIVRTGHGVVVRDRAGGVGHYDHVVLATHADTSLAILGEDANPREREALSSFRYQDNVAVLHRDPSFMPTRRRAWSSWNYLAEEREPNGLERVSLSYWMNRLQNLQTQRPVILTLNPARQPRAVEHVSRYSHPQFDASAVEAQARIPSIQGARRTWFCGSYLGFGFHEDALRSGLEVASALGSPAPWWRGTIDSTLAPVPATIGA
jgi:predicted NAD/FAD-binding protein